MPVTLSPSSSASASATYCFAAVARLSPFSRHKRCSLLPSSGASAKLPRRTLSLKSTRSSSSSQPLTRTSPPAPSAT